MIGSTAHGVLTTCKLFALHLYRFLHAAVSPIVNLLYVHSLVIHRFFLFSFFVQGHFCIQGT